MGAKQTTRKTPTKAEKDRRAAQAAAAKAEGQQTEVANCIIITRVDDGQGNIQIEAAPLGDVKLTEVPTILGMAKKQVERRLGIAE